MGLADALSSAPVAITLDFPEHAHGVPFSSSEFNARQTIRSTIGQPGLRIKLANQYRIASPLD